VVQEEKVGYAGLHHQLVNYLSTLPDEPPALATLCLWFFAHKDLGWNEFLRMKFI
jgi:hypothetical protein